jgi:hypothetical protein
VRGQVSHPHKKAGNITVLYIVIEKPVGSQVNNVYLALQFRELKDTVIEKEL